MSEKEIEKMLVAAVRKAGGYAYKLVSPGTTGVPDRLIVLPEGKIGFVEVKAPGKKPRPEQSYQIRRLEELGCYVTVLDNPDSIATVIQEIQEYTTDDLLMDILEVGGLI